MGMSAAPPPDALVAATSVLEHVRGLLAEPRRWQPNGIATDARGHQTRPDALAAASWSLSGALQRIALTDLPGLGDALTLAVAQVALTSAVARVEPRAPVSCRFWQFERHPDTTHADVLALLGEAITLLRAA
jgi:hypothetical protein